MTNVIVLASLAIAAAASDSAIAPSKTANATVPTTSLVDYAFASGAASVSGPRDAACSGTNIRSGNPGVTSQIQLTHPLLAPGFTIDTLSLQFRYSAGYTPAPGRSANASTVSVLLVSTSGETLATVYKSPPLGEYSFDNFKGYSPPIRAANALPLGVSNDAMVFIVMEVHNNQRNLQLPLDDLARGWSCNVTWIRKQQIPNL